MNQAVFRYGCELDRFPLQAGLESSDFSSLPPSGVSFTSALVVIPGREIDICSRGRLWGAFVGVWHLPRGRQRGVAWGVRRSVGWGGEGLVRAQRICPANCGRGSGGGPNGAHGGGISVGAGRGNGVRVRDGGVKGLGGVERSDLARRRRSCRCLRGAGGCEGPGVLPHPVESIEVVRPYGVLTTIGME